MSREEELIRAVRRFYDRADREGRELSNAESWQVQGMLSEIEVIQGKSIGNHALAARTPNIEPIDFDKFNRLGAPIGGGLGGYGQMIDASPGARFISSEGFKAIADPGRRSERWTTGLIEITDGPPHLQVKGTLAESSTATMGGGGALVSIPQLVPGVVDILFQPLTLEALLLSGQATGPTVRVVVEGTATSGAAGVAERAEKPESALGLTTVDEPVKKVATWLPASEEIMEDAPAIQAYINGRLGVFVQTEVERQLIRGVAGGDEVQGLLTGRSVPVYTGGTADTRAEQLFKAMNSMRGSAFVEPEWTILNPADYEVMRLLKDSANQYFGGGPFMGQYGAGAVAGPGDAIWGKRTYVTAAIGAGTAIIGTTGNAQVWSRGGLRVEASNSADDFFRRNLIAVRAERRLALTVFRANGYVECRFAAGPGG